MAANKYTYYHVIQSFISGSWEDECFEETNSLYESKDRKAFKENLKAYQTETPYPTRVINRKELNETN